MLGAALAAMFFVGCGKSDAPSGASSGAASDGVRSVRITANDSMKFSVTEITAKPGQEVRLTFTNNGRMPKNVMGHNWVLFKPLSEDQLREISTESARNAPDHLPADRSVILAKTRMLGPGESDTITFKAPEQPGIYPFACTFPGHFVLMRGELKVE